MRKELDHKEIKKSIDEIYKLTDQLTSEAKKAQVILDKFNALREEIGHKINKIKLDREPYMKELHKTLGEFETITEFKKENGKYYMEIMDEFEEFKKLRKENEKKAMEELKKAVKEYKGKK